MVTREGRIAFIDFGIVGRVSPSAWGAVQIFFRATSSKDYERMAKALVQMGAAETDVDTDKFAEDLRRVYDAIHKLESDVVLTNSATGEGVSATMAIDSNRSVSWFSTSLGLETRTGSSFQVNSVFS
jgi:predicted unusual protein kinase regulating ubiquinone biosynthesis (AarF/ABC1/UbiB family)